MFCYKCGTKNINSASYCKNCGKQLLESKAYAGFRIRFGAYFIDFIGFYILSFIIGFILGFLGLIYLIPTSGLGETIFGYAVIILYSTFFLSLWSTTPGKIIYGLTVTDENDEKLTFSSAFKRSLLQPISMLLFGAGYWNMNKNEKKQAWHDKSAHTIVVMKKKNNYIIQIILTIVGIFIYFYLISLGSTQ